MDVFKDETIDAAIETIVEREGRLDALVYSAVFYVSGAAEETSLTDVQDQMHALFFGPIRCAQAVLPLMRKQVAGRLVFMSSLGSVVAIPFHAAYSASKGALSRWTEALAYEIAPFNI